MSESTGGEQLCLETDPDGDVVLRFSEPECDASISFRVSSKVLRLASPVFVRMLSPTFKEGHALLHEDRVVIELEDDDPSLMELILNILHHQADVGEHLVDAEKLARLAIHCDKYDCIKALSPWAATRFTKLEESKSLRPLYGFQLLAAYLFNNPSNFLKISKAAVCTLEPSCPAQWSQEEILALLPESVSNAVTENIESILDLMKDELQNAESRLREFHRCYEMAHLLCISCGRALPEVAKRCHPCRNANLLRKYCTEETRVAEYFAVLRKVELWPTRVPFGQSSTADIAFRFLCAKADLKHNCAAGKGCPLFSVLELLLSKISQIQGSVGGFCLLCVRHVEDWRHDAKCFHES